MTCSTLCSSDNEKLFTYLVYDNENALGVLLTTIQKNMLKENVLRPNKLFQYEKKI